MGFGAWGSTEKRAANTGGRFAVSQPQRSRRTHRRPARGALRHDAAPVSGSFGIVAGFVAGGFRTILTTNIRSCTGMNPTTTGSGGLIAAVTLPVRKDAR